MRRWSWAAGKRSRGRLCGLARQLSAFRGPALPQSHFPGIARAQETPANLRWIPAGTEWSGRLPRRRRYHSVRSALEIESSDGWGSRDAVQSFATCAGRLPRSMYTGSSLLDDTLRLLLFTMSNACVHGRLGCIDIGCDGINGDASKQTQVYLICNFGYPECIDS